MEDSKIEWTDNTFNPWTGCAKVSEACHRCYAESLEAIRYKRVEWGLGKARRRTSESNWKLPQRWNRRARASGDRARVFCASLADVFDSEVPQAWRRDLWDLIRETEQLDWLLLTKRPQNLAGMLPSDWGNEGWPNVWLGVTAENQRRADERLPVLLETPARVHFASCEPLLGPLDLSEHLSAGLSWVIAGGETGHGSRATSPSWIRNLRDQVIASGARFHFKQWGDHDANGVRVGRKRAGRLLDGRTWDEVPAGSKQSRARPDRFTRVQRDAGSRVSRARPDRLTRVQRDAVLESLQAGLPSGQIVKTLGVSPGQVRAVKAHLTMGTYD